MAISEDQLAEILIGNAKIQLDLLNAVAMGVDQENARSLVANMMRFLPKYPQNPSLEHLPLLALGLVQGRISPDNPPSLRLLEEYGRILAERG